jgi:hypothetical protein
MSLKNFVDKCVLIANFHPKSTRIGFENDICIKAGINSFINSLEYRDSYIIISNSLDDSAVYIEAITPIAKILVLIDGRGTLIVGDSDYQYLTSYVDILFSQIPKD